ncbi:FMN-binding protein [Agromyces endophyticus]|uniref:FMN-binding protein n=1 Tax=Agromyces sp. H17E-10 TaxID=2932244 RepID=UPI001FD05356|nr:FMN-binding protein [Agromyces sp. H17E-10]UOQ88320.1 FMN-binding protein [Agromyces sp. H17E-10]
MRRRAIILASAASAAAILGGWQLGQAATASLTATGTPAVTNASAGTGSSTGTGAGTSTGSGTVDFDALTPSDSGSGSGSSAGSTGSGDAGSGDSGSGDSASTAADGTYAGQTVSTRFGDVQVQVTISGGAIADVTPLHLTDHDGRSVQISNRAAPVLRSAVLQAQTASVSFVSGATYTSAAYLQSLQSALDAAGFTG